MSADMLDYMHSSFYKYNIKQEPCSRCLNRPKTVMLQTKEGALFHPKCLSSWPPRLVIVLPKGPLSDYNHKKAFELAIKLGNLALVKDVLRYGPVSEGIKQQAINKATKKPHPQLVALLSQQDSDSNTSPTNTPTPKKIASTLQMLSHQPITLNHEFRSSKIQELSEEMFDFGAKGKDGLPPSPRRKNQNSPDNLEAPTDKPIIQVTNISLLSNQILNTSMISEKDQQNDKSDTLSISKYLDI